MYIQLRVYDMYIVFLDNHDAFTITILDIYAYITDLLDSSYTF